MTDSAAGVSPRLAAVSPWQALRVRSNHERAVESTLHARGFDAFCPVYQAQRRWSDRVKTIVRPLFPGYLFARGVSVPELLQIAGVAGVLGGNWTPAEIPNSEIENVRRVISSLLPVSPAPVPVFAPGERVTIRSGALAGVSGIVRKHAKGTRFIVTVSMMNGAVGVEIDAAAIRKDEPCR